MSETIDVKKDIEHNKEKLYVVKRNILPEPHRIRNILLKLPREISTEGNYYGQRCEIDRDCVREVDDIIIGFLRENGINIQEYNYAKYFTLAKEDDYCKSLVHDDQTSFHIIIYLSPYQNDVFFTGTPKNADIKPCTFNFDEYNMVNETIMEFNTAILLDTSLHHAPKIGRFGNCDETARMVMMYTLIPKDSYFIRKKRKRGDVPSSVIGIYNLDITLENPLDVYDIKIIKYFKEAVDLHCFSFTEEYFDNINNVTYSFSYEIKLNKFEQLNAWSIITRPVIGIQWVLIYIVESPKKGGLCHIIDIPNNKVHNIRPLKNKLIIIPYSWLYRFRFSVVEEGNLHATVYLLTSEKKDDTNIQ